MASRILQKSKRLVAFWPSLREISKQSKAFSSATFQTILGPEDDRLPLPGNVGLGTQLTPPRLAKPPLPSIAELLPDKQGQRQSAFVIYFQVACEKEFQSGIEEFEREHIPPVECLVQECPKLMRKDIQELFPSTQLLSGPCTVITLTQKTVNDMSSWNESVDQEREELIGYFHLVADSIQEMLNSAGYWADFIDPSSGKPHIEKYTNATFLETDERYRNFGFKIEDLGCCKVIEHHMWGKHSFVGSIFTNAAIDSPVFTELMKICSSFNSQ